MELLLNSPPALSTLNGGISNSATTATLVSATGFGSAGNFRVLIDSELMLVGGVTGNVLTGLTRGIEGTSAVAHNSGATVAAVATAGSLAAYLLQLPNLQFNGGRLTVSSGTPVTTSDNTGAGTLYWCPFNGDVLTLLDSNANKIHRQFAQTSFTVPSTTNTLYDVFAYDNAGTLALENLAWTSSGAGTSARASAITFQKGMYVKSSDVTRRLLGTFMTGGTSGQTIDSLQHRLVSNLINPVPMALTVANFTTHTYGTATFRAWNNDLANSSVSCVLDTLLGVQASLFSGTFVSGLLGIGVNATTSIASVNSGVGVFIASGFSNMGCTYMLPGTSGYNYFAIVEIAYAAGVSFAQGSLQGMILA